VIHAADKFSSFFAWPNTPLYPLIMPVNHEMSHTMGDANRRLTLHAGRHIEVVCSGKKSKSMSEKCITYAGCLGNAFRMPVVAESHASLHAWHAWCLPITIPRLWKV
jgi:hypothetical protein